MLPRRANVGKNFIDFSLPKIKLRDGTGKNDPIAQFKIESGGYFFFGLAGASPTRVVMPTPMACSEARPSLACAPIGPVHRVTRVRDNIILELDGRSAYEVFAEAAGPLVADLTRAMGFIFLAVPTAPDTDRLERGNFIVRNVLGASPEHGAIAVAHRPAVGDLIGFALRDGERSRVELKAMLEDVGSRTGGAQAFALYFDCVSRGSGLYGLPDHDSAYIGQQLGSLPVAGFFTGFEFGPLGGVSGLLQYCGVLALVSEKKGSQT